MPGHVFTGAPGAGKTALLRLLELRGHAVVEEAATDVIALRQALGEPEPWTRPGFVEEILALQLRREERWAALPAALVDRSPVCTLALSRYIGVPPPRALLAAAERTLTGGRYAPAAFLLRGLGFVTPTAARRIGLAEAVRFERIHENTYAELGFELVEVPPGPLAERADLVEAALSRPRSPAAPAPPARPGPPRPAAPSAPAAPR